MLIPIEIINEIFVWTRDPRLIIGFEYLLTMSTIRKLLSNKSVKSEIKCGTPFNINMLRLLKKYDHDRYKYELKNITASNWYSLIKYHNLTDNILLIYQNYIDCKLISDCYMFMDDSLIKLASILDWEIIIIRYNLSNYIITKFVNVYFTWPDILKYKKVTNKIVEMHIDKFTINDLFHLFLYDRVNQKMFRKYFYKFNNYQLLGCIYDYISLNLKYQTVDLVDWDLMYFKWKFELVLNDIKVFIPEDLRLYKIIIIRNKMEHWINENKNKKHDRIVKKMHRYKSECKAINDEIYLLKNKIFRHRCILN